MQGSKTVGLQPIHRGPATHQIQITTLGTSPMFLEVDEGVGVLGF